MYGTTLIWFISLRPLRLSISMILRCSLLVARCSSVATHNRFAIQHQERVTKNEPLS
jgi:hypothetical protein